MPLLSVFQSTLPAWGATFAFYTSGRGGTISIHAPRVGSDDRVGAGNGFFFEFQSTLPAWGATACPSAVCSTILLFQSTLPAWGATADLLDQMFLFTISIHAPRVGSDIDFVTGVFTGDWISIHAPRVGSDSGIQKDGHPREISIHAPRVGSDLKGDSSFRKSKDFNPRSPRGERRKWRTSKRTSSYFNPRSPRGERRPRVAHAPRLEISIHAPRVGSDEWSYQLLTKRRNFNPRSPRGERRRRTTTSSSSANFNPRSPRGERLQGGSTQWQRQNFNPRSPRGERQHATQDQLDALIFQSTLPAWGATPMSVVAVVASARFQSTLPAWGATAYDDMIYLAKSFQSTLPAWGATYGICGVGRRRLFQSTLPAWGATSVGTVRVSLIQFQSTLPAWGATDEVFVRERLEVISIHAPRVGSDARRRAATDGAGDFNPRSPRGERRARTSTT